jgi:hypothetical protein
MAKPTILPPLQPVRVILLVFHGGIIPPLAIDAGQSDDFTHNGNS